jgi:uncharacterized protein YegL
MNTTHYHIILDKSGSMQDCIGKTIQGYNEQLQAIKSLSRRMEDQSITMGLTQFNNEVKHLFFNQDPSRCPILEYSGYIPSGTTALYDAIGTTIISIKEKVNTAIVEKTATVVIVIITDGYENASKYFNRNSIARLIQDLENTSRWAFSYLGATLDAIEVASSLSIKKSNSLSFEKENIVETFSMINKSIIDHVENRREDFTKTNFLKKQ